MNAPEFMPLILLVSLVIFPLAVLAVLSKRGDYAEGQEMAQSLKGIANVNQPLVTTGMWVLLGFAAFFLTVGLLGMSATGVGNGSIGFGIILFAVFGFLVYRRRKTSRIAEEAMRKAREDR